MMSPRPQEVSAAGIESRECPICDYPNARPYARLHDRFFGAGAGEFALFRCSACRTIFQDASQLSGRVSSFYPEGYWWRESGRISKLEGAYRDFMVSHDQLRFVLSLSQGKNLRCLDVGCGEAAFVRLALAAGLDAFGLEQSAEARALAHLPDRVFGGSEKDLIDKGEKFELITLFHSLEHMLEPFAYLRSLQKLLTRPGGLVVQVPNTRSFQARFFGRRWYGLDCPRHIHNFSLFSLLYLLGKAGYRVRRVRHFSLRDNAASMVSSLLPALDPMSQKVRLMRRRGSVHSPALMLRELGYLPLVIAAQPLAALEAALGCGGTVTVYAGIE